MKTKMHEHASLNGASSNGPIRIYDGGFGDLWILRETYGITAIIRTETIYEAHEICEDEFFREAEESYLDFEEKYSWTKDRYKVVIGEDGEERVCQPEDYVDGRLKPKFVRWDYRKVESNFINNDEFQENFGLRPNGCNIRDQKGHGIYKKDHNAIIEALTYEHIDQLNIKLDIEIDWGSVHADIMEEEANDSLGRFIPQMFASDVLSGKIGIDDDCDLKEELESLAKDGSTDGEYYWEDWEKVVDEYIYMDKFRLHHNGTLWIYDAKAFEEIDSYIGITNSKANEMIFQQ